MTLNKLMRKIEFQQKIIIGFSIGFILLGILLSIFCQYGNYWRNILGQFRSLSFDPGGWYLTSGAYFFRVRTPYFWGHPGLVLQLIIGAIIEAVYFIFHQWVDVPYSYFIVKNYPVFISGISIVMSLVHILVFFMIYKISQLIFNNPTYSMIAVLAYGTTSTVYFDINNISPDEICTFFVLFTIYMILLANETKGTEKTVARYMILAAFAATTSIFSKAAYGLPVFTAICIYLLFIKYPVLNLKVTSRMKIIVIFGLTSIITAALWSIKVDYAYFINYWTNIAVSRTSSNFWGSSGISLNHPNNVDVFLLGEFSFFLISLLGFAGMISSKHLGDNHKYYLLLLTFLFSIPMAVIKQGAPHYLFIMCATGAIVFSYQIRKIFTQFLSSSLSEKQKSVIGLIIILVIHFPSIYMISTSHIQSVRLFRQTNRPIYSAIQKINFDEKIAVNEDLSSFRKYSLGITKYSSQSIKDAVDNYFIYASSVDDVPKNLGVKYFIDINEDQTTSILVK
jgi:hypothetical protein